MLSHKRDVKQLVKNMQRHHRTAAHSPFYHFRCKHYLFAFAILDLKPFFVGLDSQKLPKNWFRLFLSLCQCERRKKVCVCVCVCFSDFVPLLDKPRYI